MTREEKIAEARRLREQGLVYREIGERLGVSEAWAKRWVNPRGREWQRKSNAKRRLRKREWDRQNYRKPCIDCGARVVWKNPSDYPERCRPCYDTMRARQKRERCEAISRLWRDGQTLAEIAAALDSTPGSINVAVVRMRQDGWDLPYRNRGYDRTAA